MSWKKLGRIYEPQDLGSLGRTHGANPTALHLEGDIFRIFFSARDDKNRSSIFFLDYELKERKILRISEKPCLGFGEPGYFDDCGSSMGWIIKNGDDYLLYYLGWNLSQNVPWRNSIGLATSKDGINFRRYSDAPILDRNHKDPISLSYPCVLRDGDKYRMWYGSNLSWGNRQEDMAHLIKYAESKDGIRWEPSGEISVPFQKDNEYAMSKPSVIKEDGVYKLWYSFRGEAYRIGYAESQDGIHFIRRDSDVGISVSDEGWDSTTIEYPFVFKHNEQKFMLYNGNEYGKTGFGLAVWS
jgi:hypothetical protein